MGDLRDMGRRSRRLQGRLERFAVRKDDRGGGVPWDWGLYRDLRLNRRQRRK